MADKPYGIFGPQPQQPGEEPTSVSGFGLGIGAVAASGFLPYKGGRLWDRYLGGARAIETAFPAAILRTFRVSEFLSPLESYGKVGVGPTQLEQGGKYAAYLKNVFGPGIDELTLTRSGAAFGTITGKGNKAIGEGLQILSGTQKGSTIADYYARLSGVQLDLEGVGGASITDSLNDDLLRVKHKQLKIQVPFHEWIDSLDPHRRQKRLILGAKYRDSLKFAGKEFALSESMQKKVARAEVATKLFRAKAASTAGRLNTLLRAPLELPVVGEAVSKIPFLKSLAVKPGSATKMFKGYIGKGLAVAAAFKGVEYIDYLRAEGNQAQATVASTFGGGALGAFIGKKAGQRFSPKGFVIGAALGLAASAAPRFDKGLLSGAASLYADTQIQRAKVSEAIGLSDSLREHEKIAPGMSSLKTALGFSGVGALTLGFGDYMHFLGSGAVQSKGADQPIWSVFQKAREARKERIHSRVWESKLGQKVSGTRIGKGLSKIKGPMAIGALGGLAVWAGVNAATGLLGGNFLASIPGAGFLGTTETPEELSDIYSGKKEIAVRKGRWWEFGRSSDYEGGRVEYFRQHAVARLQSRAYQKGLYGSEEERWDHDPVMNPLKALFGSDEWKYHYERKYAQSRPAPLTGTYGEDVPFIGPAIAATFGKLIKPRKAVRPDEWNLGGGRFAEDADLRPEDKPAYELGGIGPGAPVSPEDSSQLFNKLTYRRREAVGLIGFAEGAMQKAMTGREEVFQNLQTMGTMGKERGSEYWLWNHLNLGGGLGSTEPIRRFVPRTPSYLETYNPLRNDMPSWLPDDYFVDLKHGNPFDKLKEAEIRLPGAGYAALNPEVTDLDPENYPLIHRLKILGDVAMYSPEYRSTLERAKRANLSDSHREQLNVIVDQVSQKRERRKFSQYRFNNDLLNAQEVTVTEVLSPGLIKTKEFGDTEIALQGVGSIQRPEEAFGFAREALEGRRLTLQTPTLEGRSYTRSGQLKAVAMLGDTSYGSALASEGYATERPLKDEFEQLQFSSRERLAGQFAETAMHGIDTPLEMLTPMSPASKLIRKRSPIEEYAKTEAIGTSNAFWDKPIKNFVQPALSSMKYEMGLADIPKDVQEKRKMSEYFDMLSWAKGQKLGDEKMKRRTVFGTDVFGALPERALPRRDRDFFDEFVEAQTETDRAQILNLIPEDQQRVYVGQWMQQEETASLAKISAKRGTDYDNQVLATTKALRKSEGFSISEDLEEQWMSETGGQVPYDEWIRQKKAEEYFSTHSLPGADWLGWCIPPDQDLISKSRLCRAGDVKLNQSMTTLQGERQVEQKFKRRTKENMTNIIVHHNSVHSMSATDNHIVLAIRGEKCKYNLRPESICSDRSISWKCKFCESKHYESYSAKWTAIKEIDVDTFMPIPLLKHVDKDPVFDLGLLNCFPKNTLILEEIIRPKNGRIKPMNRKVKIDESLAWLIGYYLAEGNVWAVGDRMRGVQFTAHIKEIPILELAKKIIKEKFGLDGVIRIKKTPNSHSAYLVVASGLFGWVIDHWVGRYCDKKFSPIWLEEITLESQTSLLDGLNTGDAAKDKRGRLILANRNLCEMAKRIYEANGTPASLHGPKKRNGKPQYSVTPLQSSLNVIIGDNFMAYRVEKTNNFVYEGEVLDFEIAEEHIYCSPIGIYHNSPSVDLEDVKMKTIQMEGLDYHDFDLWGAREKSLAQKPYIDDDLIREMQAGADLKAMTESSIEARNLAKMSRGSTVQLSSINSTQDNRYNIEIKDGRDRLIQNAYARLGA